MAITRCSECQDVHLFADELTSVEETSDDHSVYYIYAWCCPECGTKGGWAGDRDPRTIPDDEWV